MAMAMAMEMGMGMPSSSAAIHPSTAGHRSDTYAVHIPDDAPPLPSASQTETPGGGGDNQPSPRGGGAFFTRPRIVLTLLIVFSAISVTLIILGVIYLLATPKHPTLSISDIMVTHPWARRPRVLISLKSDNPNAKAGVLYDNGGTAALSFKNNTVATGPFPAFFQGEKGSRTLDLVLKASKKTMPRQVNDSILHTTNRLPLTLDLTMNVPVRMRVSRTDMWIEELVFGCRLKVNTLSNNSRVLLHGECPIKTAPK